MKNNDKVMRPDWMAQAACKAIEGELFYPDHTAATAALDAKKICRMCPVIRECLQWAFKVDDQWAVLGGMTARERVALRKRVRMQKRKALERTA